MGKTMIRRLGSPALCLLITATPGLAHDVGRFDPAPCAPGQQQVMVRGP
jgi:hypothetical protein